MHLATARQRTFAPVIALGFLVVATLACGTSGDTDQADADMQATADALQATSDALDAKATQQAQGQKPTQQAKEPAEQPPVQSGAGGTVELEVVNDSTTPVCVVLISPTTNDTWGDDWLGSDEVIAPSTTRTFDVPTGVYDLRALDCDGNDLGVQPGINLDSPHTWTFTGTGFFYDDFEVADTTAWEIFGGSEVSGGEFHLGPFVDCADVATNQLYGCFSQCWACGEVGEYDMSVSARYADGVTDRTFGLVLRFIDYNGNGFVDTNDYYLDFELSIWNQRFIIWEHPPSGTWVKLADSVEGSIAGGRDVNNLRAVAYNGGSDFDVYVNGINVYTITDVPYTEGTVGLAVGGRALEVAFDDFSFIPAGS